jgi:hypothetical protein
MASAFDNIAGLPFTGQGSKSASMTYLIMVAKVVGEITQDEQLLAIAQQLPGLQAPQQPAQPGVLQGAV